MIRIRQKVDGYHELIVDNVGKPFWQGWGSALVEESLKLTEAHNAIYDELAGKGFSMAVTRLKDFSLPEVLVRISCLLQR